MASNRIDHRTINIDRSYRKAESGDWKKKRGTAAERTVALVHGSDDAPARAERANKHAVAAGDTDNADRHGRAPLNSCGLLALADRAQQAPKWHQEDTERRILATTSALRR